MEPMNLGQLIGRTAHSSTFGCAHDVVSPAESVSYDRLGSDHFQFYSGLRCSGQVEYPLTPSLTHSLTHTEQSKENMELIVSKFI